MRCIKAICSSGAFLRVSEGLSRLASFVRCPLISLTSTWLNVSDCAGKNKPLLNQAKARKQRADLSISLTADLLGFSPPLPSQPCPGFRPEKEKTQSEQRWHGGKMPWFDDRGQRSEWAGLVGSPPTSIELRLWPQYISPLFLPPTLPVSRSLPQVCRKHILTRVSLDGALQLAAVPGPVHGSLTAGGTLSRTFSRSRPLLSFVAERPSMCAAREAV